MGRTKMERDEASKWSDRGIRRKEGKREEKYKRKEKKSVSIKA